MKQEPFSIGWVVVGRAVDREVLGALDPTSPAKRL